MKDRFIKIKSMVLVFIKIKMEMFFKDIFMKIINKVKENNYFKKEDII
jgi:hypothetical protein